MRHWPRTLVRDIAVVLQLARLVQAEIMLARRRPEMSRTSQATMAATTESDACARQRGQEAVQEAMDRRDNGGDSAPATDNRMTAGRAATLTRTALAARWCGSADRDQPRDSI